MLYCGIAVRAFICAIVMLWTMSLAFGNPEVPTPPQKITRRGLCMSIMRITTAVATVAYLPDALLAIDAWRQNRKHLGLRIYYQFDAIMAKIPTQNSLGHKLKN